MLMGSIDSFGFRNLTYPTFTYTPNNVAPQKPSNENVLLSQPSFTFTPDNRYPAYSAIMSDARYNTDYRPKCTKNVAPQNQFGVKSWMVKNADEIMELSRKRQIEWTGAPFGLAALNPPPAVIQTCDADKCSINNNNEYLAMGIERNSAPIPDLFGTFEFHPTTNELLKDSRKVSLTTNYEGGRNTPRSF
jgi:hypothetical protein